MSERRHRNAARRVLAAATGSALLAACGQTGRLYLPERDAGSSSEVVTRPAQTPPAEPAPASNSPQTVDSPPAPDTPAPEVTEPEDRGSGKKRAPAPPPDPHQKN